MKKSIKIFITIFLFSILTGCREKDAREYYINVKFKFESSDKRLKFNSFKKGTLTVYDMHEPEQGNLNYPCTGDTIIRLIKGFYFVSFDGILNYQLENDNMEGQFRTGANIQEVFISDTTITLLLNKMR